MPISAFRIRLVSLFSGLLAAHCATALEPEAILERCDAARGNLDGVEWTVDVAELEGGEAVEERRIHVRARGFDMVAETLAPAAQKGHTLILIKNNMWFHKPGLSKPVPVSLRQKLTGKAANGDIASTNYAEDYTVTATAEDVLDGEPCHVFDLRAATGAVTYARIRYWVSVERQVGLRAEYFTASGDKRIKTARMRYDHVVERDGRASPFISEMLIAEALTSDDLTRLSFSAPELRPIPDRIFNLNALGR